MFYYFLCFSILKIFLINLYVYFPLPPGYSHLSPLPFAFNQLFQFPLPVQTHTHLTLTLHNTMPLPARPSSTPQTGQAEIGPLCVLQSTLRNPPFQPPRSR